jgi:hypothetical protein
MFTIISNNTKGLGEHLIFGVEVSGFFLLLLT